MLKLFSSTKNKGIFIRFILLLDSLSLGGLLLKEKVTLRDDLWNQSIVRFAERATFSSSSKERHNPYAKHSHNNYDSKKEEIISGSLT